MYSAALPLYLWNARLPANIRKIASSSSAGFGLLFSSCVKPALSPVFGLALLLVMVGLVVQLLLLLLLLQLLLLLLPFTTAPIIPPGPSKS
jgi:hypothetical protein